MGLGLAVFAVGGMIRTGAGRPDTAPVVGTAGPDTSAVADNPVVAHPMVVLIAALLALLAGVWWMRRSRAGAG